jgi:predicted PurR-regulated permease PerM
MPATAAARERWMLIFLRVWAIIGVLLLLAAAGWLLSMLSGAIVPFALGLLVVLLLRGPVDLLSKRMPRVLAVALCYVGAFIVVAVALTFIVPPIVAQIGQFVGAVPGYAQQAFKLWDANIVHPAKGSGVPDWLQNGVMAVKDQIVAGAGSWSTAIAQGAVSAGSSIATGLFSMVLALVVGFYALADLPEIGRELFDVAGERFRGELTHALSTVTRVLGGWLRGTLIQSTVMAVLMSAGLAIVGLKYALALGVIGGLFNIVPYVGPFIVLALVAAAGFFISPWTAVWALVVVVAVQQLDVLVLAPRIMSKQVDLHPLLVIFAILVGSALFGVPGLVLAVPVAAVIKGLFVYWFEKKTERTITTEDGALFKTPKTDEPAAD